MRLPPIPAYTAGRVIDSIWIVFNAAVPLFISLIRARTEKPLIVTIDMLGPNFTVDLAKNGDKFEDDVVAA